tara:strand:+ start:166 stop:456 length:291 start_codon:yes stop_codon:yes gene_type:complete
MKNRWKQIRSFKIGTPDGSTENYTLSENKDTGDFRIENDFGNISIEMERMSGYEFLKKIVREMEDAIIPDDPLDDPWLNDLLDDDTNDDLNCDHTD